MHSVYLKLDDETHKKLKHFLIDRNWKIGKFVKRAIENEIRYILAEEESIKKEELRQSHPTPLKYPDPKRADVVKVALGIEPDE